MIYHLDKYDWIVSVEVAEHIPKIYEHIFVDNLVRHAKDGIVLSWATIGQDGLSHVNEKNFLDVKEIMRSKGFEHDETNSNLLKKASSLSWLRNNINVFNKL